MPSNMSTDPISKEEKKYYNIWYNTVDSWTSGYRTLNGISSFQEPNRPWLLSWSEVIEWLKNDWGCRVILNASLSIEECNRLLKKHLFSFEIREYKPDPSIIDKQNREEHALKYL